MDNYDKQIQDIISGKKNLISEYCSGEGIFKFVGPRDNPKVGCIGMIRERPHVWRAFIKGQENLVVTQEIAKDERIPKKAENIKEEHLPIFAEWQRKIDKLNK